MKRYQLSRFVELAVLDLGEMEPPVDFLEESMESRKDQAKQTFLLLTKTL